MADPIEQPAQELAVERRVIDDEDSPRQRVAVDRLGRAGRVVDGCRVAGNAPRLQLAHEPPPAPLAPPAPVAAGARRPVRVRSIARLSSSGRIGLET